eukprot:TRINITY_DN15548_c0_g4_i1.p1 TRINITY_DN15548_c0_g4~~TRINITY_DN15548_c0_g4_i1.p1  ORF type:complete len:726 (+),score=190.05 TRINITY_DN15548_c0_g4_i1:95-2272(+)
MAEDEIARRSSWAPSPGTPRPGRRKRRQRWRCAISAVRFAVRLRRAAFLTDLTSAERAAAHAAHTRGDGLLTLQSIHAALRSIGVPSDGLDEILASDLLHYRSGSPPSREQFELLVRALKRRFLRLAAQDDTERAFVALGGSAAGVEVRRLLDVVRSFDLTLGADALDAIVRPSPRRRPDDDDEVSRSAARVSAAGTSEACRRLQFDEFAAMLDPELGEAEFPQPVAVSLSPPAQPQLSAKDRIAKSPVAFAKRRSRIGSSPSVRPGRPSRLGSRLGLGDGAPDRRQSSAVLQQGGRRYSSAGAMCRQLDSTQQPEPDAAGEQVASLAKHFSGHQAIEKVILGQIHSTDMVYRPNWAAARVPRRMLLQSGRAAAGQRRNRIRRRRDRPRQGGLPPGSPGPPRSADGAAARTPPQQRGGPAEPDPAAVPCAVMPPPPAAAPAAAPATAPTQPRGPAAVPQPERVDWRTWLAARAASAARGTAAEGGPVCYLGVMRNALPPPFEEAGGAAGAAGGAAQWEQQGGSPARGCPPSPAHKRGPWTVDRCASAGADGSAALGQRPQQQPFRHGTDFSAHFGWIATAGGSAMPTTPTSCAAAAAARAALSAREEAAQRSALGASCATSAAAPHSGSCNSAPTTSRGISVGYTSSPSTAPGSHSVAPWRREAWGPGGDACGSFPSQGWSAPSSRRASDRLHSGHLVHKHRNGVRGSVAWMRHGGGLRNSVTPR